MAPDRTTSSFVAASTLNLPLSSKGPNHAPSLERGKACLTCRSRKVKCDGVKPVCGACSRSAIAHGEDPSKLACNFNEDESRGEKRKRGPGAGGAGKVAALEAKIAELERFISQSGATQQQESPSPGGLSQVASTSSATPPIAMPTFSTGTFMDTSYGASPNNFNSTSRTSFDVLLQASTASHSSSNSLFNTNPETNSFFQAPPSFFDNTIPMLANQTPPTTPPDPLLELFYPGWPKDLPSPTLVQRLVKVFFSKSHCASGMISQRKFELALTLPPTHAGFPHSSLIHAMLAMASRMVSEDFFAQEEKYWGKTDPTETVADYHGNKAQASIDQAIARGERLFQVCQAVILLCFYAYTNGRFVMVWLTCGLATRMATPLGLNHLRPLTSTIEERPMHLKPSMLPPPIDEEELYERSATFWFAVVCDRFASASTGWPMGLNDEDISSLLPSPIPAPDDDLITSPLCHLNPSFLMNHPPHLVQPLQLYLKSIVLLGRVITFMQRSPPPMGMAVSKEYRNGNEEPVDPRTTPAFKRLDAETVTFRLSIPREYNSSQPHVSGDTRLCVVYAIPHVCTILLHEPFCTMADGDVSFTRCMVSAKAILESIYSLWSTSFDIGYLAPFINYCWAVAGRTLVRDLAIRQAKGITTGIEDVRSDISVILNAMRAYKSPLGDSVAYNLQKLLDDPSHCLPSQHFSFLCFGSDGVVGGINKHKGASANIKSLDQMCVAQFMGLSPNGTVAGSGSGSGGSPGGTFSSTSAPSPVDFTALFDQGMANAGQVAGSPSMLDPDKFKEMMMSWNM